MNKLKNIKTLIHGIIIIILIFGNSCKKDIELKFPKKENFSIEFYDDSYCSGSSVIYYLSDTSGNSINPIEWNGDHTINFNYKLDQNINTVNIAHYFYDSKKVCRIQSFQNIKSPKWFLRNPESNEYLDNIYFNINNFPSNLNLQDIIINYKFLDKGQFGVSSYNGTLSGNIMSTIEPNCILISILSLNKSVFINNLYSSNTYTIDYNSFMPNDTTYVNFSNVSECFKNLSLFGYEDEEYPYSTKIEIAGIGDPDLTNKKCPVFFPANIFNSYQTNIFFGNNLEWKYIYFGSIPSIVEPHFMNIQADSININEFNVNIEGDPTYCCAAFYLTNNEIQLTWEIYFPGNSNNFIIPKIPDEVKNFIGTDIIDKMNLNYVEVHKISNLNSFEEYINKKYEENISENKFIEKEVVLMKYF